MTPADLKQIRQAAEPDMTQAAFARRLGYRDGDAYRKYESGAREIPRLLEGLMQALRDNPGWRPDWWADQRES